LSAVAGAGPSGLARAPKVACAARGPRPATLAGNLVQSLPLAGMGEEPVSRNPNRPKQYTQTPSHFPPNCK